MANVYSDILEAARSLVAGVDGVESVVVRKEPQVYEEDAKPIVVLTPATEKIVDYQFGGWVWIDYPVLVVIADAANKDVSQTSLEAFATIRQDVRKALARTSLTGVSSVFDYNINFSPVFDRSLIDANYDIGAFELSWRSREQRGS